MGEFYREDLTKPLEELVPELRLWYRKLSRLNASERPTDVLGCIKSCCLDAFPNIFTLLHTFLTLPVTTCTSERSFSTLRRLKTYLRSMTSDTRMNGLAVLSIYRNYTPSPEQIINRLSETSNRRLNMCITA